MSKVVITLSIACAGAVLATACGDDGMTLAPDSGPDELDQTLFVVRIENISDQSSLATPLSPGVWAVHGQINPLFDTDSPDRGEGLETQAEDGNPAVLEELLNSRDDIFTTGVFDTPEGTSVSGPIRPRQAMEFTIKADPENTYLSFATMVGQSNDAFLAPDPGGLRLFADDGTPINGEIDVSALLWIWDAGTEANQAPGSGPVQAPRQTTHGEGLPEGVVRPFQDTTRALPAGSDIAAVEVAEDGGVYTITLINTSEQHGGIVTPLAPVLYVSHDLSWTLFTEGSEDRGEGLENLAEDGSPATLAGNLQGIQGRGKARPTPAPRIPTPRYAATSTPPMTGPAPTWAALPRSASSTARIR